MTTIMSVLAVWLFASIPFGILIGRMLKRAAAEQTIASGAEPSSWQPIGGRALACDARPGAALARVSLDH